MSQPATEEHDVRSDYAGFFQNHPRLTCYTKACGSATLVRQPFMSDARWTQEVAAFRRNHPFTEATPLPN